MVALIVRTCRAYQFCPHPAIRLKSKRASSACDWCGLALSPTRNCYGCANSRCRGALSSIGVHERRTDEAVRELEYSRDITHLHLTPARQQFFLLARRSPLSPTVSDRPSNVAVLDLRHSHWLAPIFHLGVLKGRTPIAVGYRAPPIR